MKIFALKDKACGIVHVFTANNIIAAKRAMAELMDRNHMELLYRYADDFDLLELGDMNSDTGEITEPKPKFICNMSELKHKEATNV